MLASARGFGDAARSALAASSRDRRPFQRHADRVRGDLRHRRGPHRPGRSTRFRDRAKSPSLKQVEGHTRLEIANWTAIPAIGRAHRHLLRCTGPRREWLRSARRSRAGPRPSPRTSGGGSPDTSRACRHRQRDPHSCRYKPLRRRRRDRKTWFTTSGSLTLGRKMRRHAWPVRRTIWLQADAPGRLRGRLRRVLRRAARVDAHPRRRRVGEADFAAWEHARCPRQGPRRHARDAATLRGLRVSSRR